MDFCSVTLPVISTVSEIHKSLLPNQRWARCKIYQTSARNTFYIYPHPYTMIYSWDQHHEYDGMIKLLWNHSIFWLFFLETNKHQNLMRLRCPIEMIHWLSPCICIVSVFQRITMVRLASPCSQRMGRFRILPGWLLRQLFFIPWLLKQVQTCISTNHPKLFRMLITMQQTLIICQQPLQCWTVMWSGGDVFVWEDKLIPINPMDS